MPAIAAAGFDQTPTGGSSSVAVDTAQRTPPDVAVTRTSERRRATRVNVDTDRLLAPESEDDVDLTIRVQLRALESNIRQRDAHLISIATRPQRDPWPQQNVPAPELIDRTSGVRRRPYLSAASLSKGGSGPGLDAPVHG